MFYSNMTHTSEVIIQFNSLPCAMCSVVTNIGRNQKNIETRTGEANVSSEELTMSGKKQMIRHSN